MEGEEDGKADDHVSVLHLRVLGKMENVDSSKSGDIMSLILSVKFTEYLNKDV